MRLELADGSAWHIIAGSSETAAIVSQLGAIMQLQPLPGPAFPVIVVANGSSPPVTSCIGREDSQMIVHDLGHLLPGLAMHHVFRLALAIAHDALMKGAVLLHGALAEWHGQGVVLTGPSSTGKTTASKRLPPPWRSLSDDLTLVVRDRQGLYWAHPWPTWSQFHDADVPESITWDVQRAFPLRGIFFLRQSSEDRVESISRSQIVALLIESVSPISLLMAINQNFDGKMADAFYSQQAENFRRLADKVPVHSLHFSRTGAFWKEIEQVLSRNHDEGQNPIVPVLSPLPRNKPSPDGRHQYVVYTGISMNSTLCEPDVLGVVPYNGRAVERGDVIYFREPVSGRAIVHRVLQVTAEGIRTRGDNNTEADRYYLQPADITGQVIVAWRGTRQRRIAGGWRGQFIARWVRLKSLVLHWNAWWLSHIYHAFAQTGIFRFLLPPKVRPRVFIFQSEFLPKYRIMMGRYEVGHYDSRSKGWYVKRPFRLFVDVATLPEVPD